MRVIDKESDIVVAEIVTNHGMTLDEALECYRLAVDDEGRIYDVDTGEKFDAWYESLEMEGY